jgi:CheY-like chemotaxis protein
VATRGDTGLSLAHELQPQAITLDIQLPALDGWTVLDRLKRNPRTRHIPVHVISVMDRQHRGATVGAFAYLEKPVTKDALEAALDRITSFLDRPVKQLLVVEDEPTQRAEMVRYLGEGSDIAVTAVDTGAEALRELDAKPYDCLVLDLLLPDVDGIALLETIKARPGLESLPTVVFTNRELTPDEDKRLKRSAESVILKSSVQSAEHLLSDTALFLHRLTENLPAGVRDALATGARPETSLVDRTVLIVDDDPRNIFALTGLLERQKMKVLFAENGKEGLAVLEQNPSIEVVLMDIMMPEMDGYQTMKAIRQDPRYKALPIIAVTAKALKEDRDRCIAAGANDYLPKPVQADQLEELLRLWIVS